MTTLATTPTRNLDIELLAIDLNTCTRCTGTLDNIERAIEVTRDVFDVTGTGVQVRRTLIESEEGVRRHRLVSSPTIRINGRDIVFETRESRCDTCTDLCGCEDGTDCRVWLYQGQEYTEAPVGLVVEAMLGAIYGDVSALDMAPPAYEGVPENLKRFFASTSEGAGSSTSSCCGPEEQATCCEPSEKAACCGEDGDDCGCA